MSKPCNSNGGLGCVRGFIREKCQRCIYGSITCDMCQVVSPLFDGQLNKRRISTDNNSVPVFTLDHPSKLPSSTLYKPNVPEQSLPSRTPSISYQLPVRSNPRRSSQSTSASPKSIRISVDALPAKRTAGSAPSSPTTSIRPLLKVVSVTQGPASQPCIFCIDGKKACSECFGLGYVQRICQECIRYQHHRNSRRKSLPNSLNQFGTKIKEQFSSISFSESSLSLPDNNGNSSTNDLATSIPKNFFKGKKKAQKFLYLHPRSKSMVSLPTMTSLESPVVSPILRPLNKVMEDVGEGFENVDRNDSNHNNENNNNENISSGKDTCNMKKKSFKAKIMGAFKLPTLFQSNKHAVNNRSEQRHGRQRTLRSISMINLNNTQTAA